MNALCQIRRDNEKDDYDFRFIVNTSAGQANHKILISHFDNDRSLLSAWTKEGAK
jgi:hypothetical protein